MSNKSALFPFKRDEIVFHAGGPSDRVAFIVEGAVEIIRTVDDDKAHVTGIVEAGEFVGQIGAIIGRLRAETVRSISDDTVVELLDRDEFIRRVASKPESSYDLIQRLGERLRATSRRPSDVAIFDTAKAAEIRAKSEGAEIKPLNSKFESKQIRVYPATELLDAQMETEGFQPVFLPFIVGRKPSEQELQEERVWRQRFADSDRRSGINRRRGKRSGEDRRLSDGVEVGLQLEDTRPYRLSRLHFSIQQMAVGNFIVRDLGSALGTQVNDDSLGANFPKDFTTLRDGDNRVVAGGPQSPFVFRVAVE